MQFSGLGGFFYQVKSSTNAATTSIFKLNINPMLVCQYYFAMLMNWNKRIIIQDYALIIQINPMFNL